jgi:hypothetical protein
MSPSGRPLDDESRPIRIRYRDGISSGIPQDNCVIGHEPEFPRRVVALSFCQCQAAEVYFVEESPEFLRCDANSDGAVDVSDMISTLNGLFRGGLQPRCYEASD